GGGGGGGGGGGRGGGGGGRALFGGGGAPCLAGPADNLAVFAALDVLQQGDVLAVATASCCDAAVAGDHLIGMARNRGLVAFVTDGCVRDKAGIALVGLPCFAVGLTPNSAARNGAATVGLPVVLGGVVVSAGDLLVGDEEGVVVVPQSAFATLAARLEAVRRAEAMLDAEVKAGLGLPNFVSRILAGRIHETD